MHLYNKIKSTTTKHFAVLVDPDKNHDGDFKEIARKAEAAGVDFLFVGGSLLTRDTLGSCIGLLKENCDIPVVLFPGSVLQVDSRADAILLLSLISGRNPELLIGSM